MNKPLFMDLLQGQYGHFLLTILLLFSPDLCFAESAPAISPSSQAESPRPLKVLSPKDYTYAYWLNGFRKPEKSPSEDILCFESGTYGFALNIGKINKAKFALAKGSSDYSSSLATGSKLFNSAKEAKFLVEVELAGKTYYAVTCDAAKASGARRLEAVRLWESGRYAQNFDILGLELQNDRGEKLSCSADLRVVAWPNSISFESTLAPTVSYVSGNWKGILGAGRCLLGTHIDIPHSDKLESEEITVECWVFVPEELAYKNNNSYLLCKNSNNWKDGSYGFTMSKDKFIATMNIGGGRTSEFTVTSREKSYKKNVWTHLALSYDGTTMKFFINGLSQGEKSIKAKRTLGKGHLRLGKRADGCGDSAYVLIDELRVWNRPFSSSEIKTLAASPELTGARNGLSFEENFGSEIPSATEAPAWNDAKMSISLSSADGEWKADKKVSGLWSLGQRHSLALTCNIGAQNPPSTTASVKVTTAKGISVPVEFKPSMNCYVANVNGLKRDWEAGYTDIRNYDDFKIEVKSGKAEDMAIPFLLDFINPANITGLVPMLCDENGAPTGIPVQLSKNWHNLEIGAYLRAYALLPASSLGSRYILRIAYGFYGTLPSASHAQLSLIGYGGNGRWDQMAIGCWGETFCFDMDMSLTDVTITDVRGLMLRNGAKGTCWSWTDGGWGGDWLHVKNSAKSKLLLGEIKTAYFSQGPCLTDVRYRGYYGSDRDVQFDAQVQTLRTDDYPRTFHNLNYRFLKPFSFQGGWVFKMGNTASLVTPQIAYGNRKGLLAEKSVPATLKVNEAFVENVTLTGDAPWWVAFPGAHSVDGRTWGTGSRALIIRSYVATYSGNKCYTPTITMPVNKKQANGEVDLDLLLVPPKGCSQASAGDTVSLEAEWIVLPRIVDDYYGPNEALKKHLAEFPRSWETVHREAKGNDLKVVVDGGLVTKKYPLVIRSYKPEVRFKIDGGVGVVPVVIESLATVKNLGLYRVVDNSLTQFNPAVHGNDFWQATYDTSSQRYSICFNLPLDGLAQSEWVLKEIRMD